MRAVCAVALLAGGVSAVAAGPAAAAAGQAAGRVRAAALSSSLITPDVAQSQAESSGTVVAVTSLSTPDSTTVANPDGSFTTTESTYDTQKFVNGAWTPLSATLQANPNGSYSPAVPASPLVLSGGGNTALATMTAAGRTLTVSWPGSLPAPAVSGPTATYVGVFPGVNLVVTADDQGGFSDVLVVTSAAAAANPALSALQLTVTTSGGLVLSTDASGDLIAAAGSSDPPLISFDAPQIWDSTPGPPGEATVTNGDGVTVDAASGDPVASSAEGPGTGAQVASIPVSLSGNTVTLTPPASVLTGAATTYPVYIDPAWHNYASSHAASWTQVFSGYPAETANYDAGGNLRVGVCPVTLAPDCNGIGVAHTYLQMPVPSALHESTDVHAAYLYMTEDWAPSCTAKAVRLYPLPGSIGRSTDWNNAPAMPDSGSYLSQNAAFGYPGCGYYGNDITWNVTSTIANDAGDAAYQLFGLRAGDEATDSADITTSELYWKQFKSGSSNFTLSVTYNYPPNQPSHLSTDPGGGCHTAASDPAVIGNDDVTFYSYASDSDTDNNLTSNFTLYNTSGTAVYSSSSAGTNYKSGDKSFAHWTILRAGMQSYGANGATTAYKYYYQTKITDDFGLSSPLSDKCWIYYNPKGPQKPTVSLTPAQVTIGGSVTASFTSPGCSSTGNPCPSQYVYQVGAAKPVTETADSTHAWSGNIPVDQIGPLEISVHGIASGNPGEASVQQVIGTLPSTSYKDGYYSHGSYPDLLTVGTGAKPSLWLSTGSGNGTVNAPIDIGSLGTGINPGADGPGDWSGALVLHGDFTGHQVQDVMAYYPSTGNGVIIDGSGNGNNTSLDLAPYSGRVAQVKAGDMENFATSATPTDLVAAGNASGLSTGTDDLIGITSGVELDLYTDSTCTGCATGESYEYYATITTTAPDGDTDWNNYSLATAGNPASTVLFALDTGTGALYEDKGPFMDNTTGMAPAQTWTQITVPWSSSPPGTMIQGDINNTGQTELWFLTSSGPYFESYTLNGTTLTAENSTQESFVKDEWPLTDGNDATAGPTAITAVDTMTGTNATLTGGAAWNDDVPYFMTDINFNGTSRYLTPPSNTISATPTYLSVWFKTSTAGGVIASVQGSALSSGATVGGGYNPVLYVGSNGLLYAEWWNGSVDPLASTVQVDDGLWHHAVLSTVILTCFTTTCSGTTDQETLTLDGQQQQVSADALEDGNWANLDFGAGYIGGGWPNEAHHEENGNEGYLQYFNGEIADISLGYGISIHF